MVTVTKEFIPKYPGYICYSNVTVIPNPISGSNLTFTDIARVVLINNKNLCSREIDWYAKRIGNGGIIRSTSDSKAIYHTLKFCKR